MIVSRRRDFALTDAVSPMTSSSQQETLWVEDFLNGNPVLGQA